MRIGILSVQGAFIEHEKMISSLSNEFEETIECIEIRQKHDLKNIDGIILPGGESTVQGKLIKELDIFDELRELILGGLPTLATCAGLILIAQNIENDDITHLATLPVTVRRNAYGRQLGSFTSISSVGETTDYPLVFIRAPFITEVKQGVKVLTTTDDNIVGVQYKNQIGLAFHPEMTDDNRIHKQFVELIALRSKSFAV